MRHNFAPFPPRTLRHRWLLRGRPLRTVRLNMLGWLALLAGVAALGGGTWLLSNSTSAGALASAFVVLVAVVVDRTRWRTSWVSLSADSEATAKQLVQLLGQQGIEARAESVKWDDEVDVAHSVLLRQRDTRAAQLALRDLG